MDMITKEAIESMVAKVIRLLDNPRLQPCKRNSIVTDARKALIAQIFYGDRILAAMRDGVDYRDYSARMATAFYEGESALDKFVECIKNQDCEGV
jgi:hypothetical protein